MTGTPSAASSSRMGPLLAYVQDQMGHSGHLIPGADIAWVDRLHSKTTLRQDATPAQPEVVSETEIPREVIDLIGGPTRI
jgi:hypothetical protein